MNENCSQFTVSSGITRNESDSDNECKMIESFFETGDNDPQIEDHCLRQSELRGCEVRFYSARQISTFLDESVWNPQIEQFFSRFEEVFSFL